MKSLNLYILLLLDLGVVFLAHTLAYLLRFEGSVPAAQWANWGTYLPFFLAVKLACFYSFDLYRGMWRYTSLPDIFNVVKAVTTASLVMMAALLLTQRFHGYSRSVFILDWLFALLGVAGIRTGIRLTYGSGFLGMLGGAELLKRKAPPTVRKRCIILGADAAAEKLVREARSDRFLEILALFDDDPAKHGRLLHSTPVLGPLSAMPALVHTELSAAQEILIAIPGLSGEALRNVVHLCEQAGLPYKTIPSLAEIAQGRVSLKSLRDVDYKDLLPRDPVDPDYSSIAGYLKGKNVLVTGAGGSIGSELVRQILPFEPARLLLLDASECALYAIEMELRHEQAFTDYELLLGSLQDHVWTRQTLTRHTPDVVFHAAAYKHVPMLEANPAQAVLNNVLATDHLISLCLELGVERFVVVSTDKAVRPTNVMGASKRLTEKIMQARCQGAMRMMAVRFGNVVGSAGSVVPLFRRQIERGGPVTVTHPDIVRYFMTVEEACLLILQAGAMSHLPSEAEEQGGQGGEIFVLKMGQPVKIAEMARDLIRLSGKEPDVDVKIQFVGLRPGEKLFEELITEDEGVVPTSHDKIMVLKGGECMWEEFSERLEPLYEAARLRDGARIRELLKKIVPEYAPSGNGTD